MSKDFIPDGRLHPSDLCTGLFTALLDNGLKVIIKEDHRSPVAICNVWVGAGSNREPEALRGWSHGIEHLLFKGTARRGQGDFAREVAEAGGATNAGTGYETTNYHITLPVGQLPVAVDILSDALFHSAFDSAALAAEREVLVHENHMYDDVPFGFGVTWRWGMELAFDTSPYRHPIGGRDENLLERSREEILAYWRSAYRPENMAVVVVGAFSAEEAFALVRDRFGAVFGPVGPGNPEADIVASPPTEGRHQGPRLRVERGDIQKTYAKLVFPAPGDQRNVRQVMSVIRQILAEGRSSRLFREIQEEQKLVEDFVVMTEGGPREGIVVIDLETDAQRLPSALQGVCRILADLKHTGATEEELDRAKVRVARGFLFGGETVQGQAHSLGHHLMLEDLAGAFTYPDRVAAVTAAEVSALAAEVFDLDQLSVVAYLPEGAKSDGLPTDARELAALLEPALSNGAPVARAAAAAGSGSPVNRRITAGQAGPFATAALADGSEICFRIDRTVPVLSFTLTTLGGACAETATTAGLTSLTVSAQIKGAGSRDSASLHRELESQGAVISPLVERDYLGLVFSGLSERLEGPLDLLGDLILGPRFAPEEIEQERRLALEELAALEDNPLQLGVARLREALYGDHPYGRPLAGTTGSLPGLTRAQIHAAHAAAWARGNLQICLSGDFDPDTLLPRLERILSGLPAGKRTIPQVGPARIPDGAETMRLQRKINQCVLLVGWPGPLHPDQQRPARLLLQEILNGQNGRLFEELRNRRSLCYNTGVAGTTGFGQGMLLAYVLTAPESEAEARTALIAELARMGRESVGEAELARAKAKLVGNLLIGNQSNSAKVGRAAPNRVYGRAADDLPALVDQIKACGPLEIREAAAGTILPDRRFEVVVSPR